MENELSRRDVLRLGLGAGVLGALGGCAEPAEDGAGYLPSSGAWRNWSGGQSSRPAAYLVPASEDALAKALRDAKGPVRPVGASHSFSPLVASDGVIVSLDGLKGLVGHDAERKQATFWAGTRVREAGEPLFTIGQGLLNQGDVDPQSLAGAIGTSTHGTGIQLGSFSSLVRGLRLVTPGGDVIECDAGKDADVFHAACTSVGALGVVTQVTLQNRSAYHLRERTFAAPLAEVFQNLEKWRDENRHFEFWPFFEAELALVKILTETTDPPTPAPTFELPAETVFWLACKIAHGIPATDGAMQSLVMKLYSATDRVDRSYRIFPSARNVRFNEMEYEVPAESGPECVKEVLAAVRKSGVTTLFPLEYRYVAADDCWLSPFYQRATASISVHQFHEVDPRPLYAVAEPILRRHGGRPHWGKLHTMTATDLEPLYPKWQAFQAVRRRLDPEGKMLNSHLRSLFVGGAAA